MDVLDWLVRGFSVVLLAFLAHQLAGGKGTRLHRAVGALTGAAGFIVLCLVLVRGYYTAGEQHGGLYPVHVLLAVPAYAGLAVVICTGVRMGRANTLRARAWHRFSGRMSAFAFALSLVAGVASVLMR